MPIDEQLMRYFEARADERASRVVAVLGAMNPRERRLVREAAVMGFVRGAMYGDHENIRQMGMPPDSSMLAEVVSACLSMPDLYPTFERMERTALRRESRG